MRCRSSRSCRSRSTCTSGSTRAPAWRGCSRSSSPGVSRCSRSAGSRSAPARGSWRSRVADALSLYVRLVGAQVRSQLQYRLSFVLDVVGAFLISFLDFLAVLVIFHNVPTLSGWSVQEVAFLYAASSISFALTDLAIGHLDLFPRKIRDGSFDVL